MRRKIVAAVGSFLVIILAWTLPYYIEVNEIITAANSNLLLYISIGCTGVFGIVLLWAVWPILKRIRFQRPIKYKTLVAEPPRIQGTTGDAGSLDFSVKVETITYRSGPIYFVTDAQTSPGWLVVGISFRTNQTVQIASLHLEIDAIDPRDIIEPDSEAVQGFTLPHILERAETHRFQFQLSSENTEKGEHQLRLKVLAGGQWYEDGPYTLNHRK